MSNYRLFVPLVLASLGRERVYDIVCEARADLGLGQQSAAWRASITYLSPGPRPRSTLQTAPDLESASGQAEDCTASSSCS